MEREECLKYFLGNKKFTKIHIFRTCEDKMLFSFRCNRAKRSVQTFWVSYTISLAFKYRYTYSKFYQSISYASVFQPDKVVVFKNCESWMCQMGNILNYFELPLLVVTVYQFVSGFKRKIFIISSILTFPHHVYTKI